MSEELALAVIPDYTPARIDFDFEAANGRLDGWLSVYEGMTEDGLAGCRDAELRDMRADLNAARKQLNDARIAIHKDYDRPYEEYKAGVDALVARIDEKAGIVKAVIDRREKERRAAKRAEIEAAYRDFAPMLAGTAEEPGPLPFDRVIEGEKWLNRSPSTARAIEEMQEKVSRIVADYSTLQDQEGRLAFYAEDEAVFFRTLSLKEALDHEKARAEETGRIEAMKAQRAEVSPAPTPTPAPEPEPEGPAYREDMGRDEQLASYVVVFDPMTEGQLAGLMEWCRANGVHGTVRRSVDG